MTRPWRRCFWLFLVVMSMISVDSPLRAANVETLENVEVMKAEPDALRLQVRFNRNGRGFKIKDAKFKNSAGEPISQAEGLEQLKSAKTVTIKTKPDPKQKQSNIAAEIQIDPEKKSKRGKSTSSDAKNKTEEMDDQSEVASTEGKPLKVLPKKNILPKASKMDLRPAAEWKERIPDVRVQDRWYRWYGRAKKGDFVEYDQGGDDSSSWVRYEVVDVDGDKVTIATILQVSTEKTENRARVVPGKDQLQAIAEASKPPEKKTSKPANNSEKMPKGSKEPSNDDTETLTVAGHDLRCKVVKIPANKARLLLSSSKWTCDEVPFDGLVKEEIDGGSKSRKTLIDLGHGE